MKAIKDCQWRVELLSYSGGFVWQAESKECDVVLCQGMELSKRGHAKNNWERRAKLEGITKWGYT